MSLPSDSVRMLWITPKYPLGTPDGARLATCSLVRELTQRQVRVDLICLVPDGEAADADQAVRELGVSTCSIIRRSRSRLWPLPHWDIPFTFRTFTAAAVRRALKKDLTRLLRRSTLSERTYLFFDGLHTFAALNGGLQNLSGQCSGIVYRAHNVETVLWEQCAEKARTPWLRWFFDYQAGLVRNFEQSVAQKVDVIAPVSEEDARKFQRLAAETRVAVTRIGIDFPESSEIVPVASEASPELLFLGRLDWLPNREGLRWFLDKVWPGVVARKPGMTLKIAGAGDGRWLERYVHLPGVTLLGRVERVDPLYRSCALCIAPLFQGSGTRVKIIESARYKRAVLSTALGAEGSGLIPGRSYLRAETADEWIGELTRMTLPECRRIGEAAYASVRERFDGRRIAGELLDSLAAVGGRT